MITNENFGCEWMDKTLANMKKRNVRANKTYVEKNIIALYLLELLAESNLEFVFKGGTALILILDEPTRFSIDIDIMMNSKFNNDDLIQIFQKFISENSPFSKVEEDIRVNKGIPKRHFYFHYDTITHDPAARYILLDIVFEEPPYTELQNVMLKNSLVETVKPYREVVCPTIRAMLGDKMTAFAPNTIGVPLDENRDVDIIKQMFDVAMLSTRISNEDIPVIKDNFESIAKQNMYFRGYTDMVPKDVLEDSIDAAFTIFSEGKHRPELYSILKSGINKLSSYVHKEKYSTHKAVRDAGKVAYLSLVIKGNINKFEPFSGQELENIEIGHEYKKELKKLRNLTDEGFYYWEKVLRVFPENKTL